MNASQPSRFFFDIEDGTVFQRDEDGTELPDAEAACAEAIAVLPDLARDMTLRANGTYEITATVRDETGQAIYRAVLRIGGERIGQQTSL